MNVYKRLMETTICSFSFRIKTFGCCCCCCCWMLLLPMSFPGCLSASLFLLLSEWLLPPLFPSQWRTCRSERPLGCHCSSFSPSCFCYRSKTRTRTVLAIRHVSWPKLSGGGHLAHSIPPPPSLSLSTIALFSPSYSIPPPPSHFPGLLGKIYDGTNRLLPAPRPTILPPLLFVSFFLFRKEDHCINSDCLLRVLSFRPGCSCLSLTLLFHRRPSCVLLPICFVSLATAGPYFLLYPPFSSVRSIHVPRQILIIPDPFQSLANSSDAIRRRFLRDSTLPPTVFILFLSTDECLYRVASCPRLSGSSSHCHSVSFDRGAVSV